MEQLNQLLYYKLILGNTPANVLMFILAIFLTLLISKAVQSLLGNQLRRLAQTSNTMLDDILLDVFERPIYWILLAIGSQFSTRALVLPEAMGSMVNNVATVVITLFVTWSISNLISALREHYVDPMVAETESKLDDQLIPIMEKTLKAALWMFAVLVMFSNMGYDILSLLTGLGIGGLAIAMAAQDTLSNIFGSVTIFADQPFHVGDLVEIDGHTGIVDEVGLRTSRLITPAGIMITIPNSHAVAGVVSNHTLNGLHRKELVLGLVYDTSGTDLRRAMDLAKQIVDEHPIATDVTVAFINFADCALEIAIRYGVPEGQDFGAVCSDVNLVIKDRFDQAGFSMAFPTMTLDGLQVLSKRQAA